MPDYTATVLPIVRATRDMLMPYYGNIEHDTKSNNTPVTRLDREVEAYLRDSLKNIYGEIDFAGEEYGGSRESDRFWLSDPIDGTSFFVRGSSGCSVMLALIEHQQVIFSVIYDFVYDIAYHAERGRGAYANGVPLQVQHTPLSDATLILEMRRESDDNQVLYKKLAARANVQKSAVSGTEFAAVATGRAGGRVICDGWGFDYDFAPGSLLVEEAGGIVANIGSHTYDYRKRDFLACNPLVYKELTEGPGAVFPIVE